MLIHSGVAESFWEEATLYTVNIYNRVPSSRANRAGIRTSPYEKLHGAKPIMIALHGICTYPSPGKVTQVKVAAGHVDENG